ncbi:unnamed protein product [Meloidogyne enterolobii]|uniref:Uncharacterized protein n=1 Tax=Meloidogyne enterolobii TaxID=390850 RepID=A0ACB0ZV05_MELEN
MPLLFIIIFQLIINGIKAEERAEVDIRVSGACSPIYLSRRGIDLGKYRPLIRFNPDKVQLIPKNPVIPGCVKIKAEGVEILKPIKNLFAEIEMRIGGSPDPNNPTLPCTKRIDDKVNQCPCAKTEGSWLLIYLKIIFNLIFKSVFCDFCRQLRAQQSKLSITETSKRKLKNKSGDEDSLEEQCKCETMQPGLYDIETEMCTPELDDTKQYIPTELQNNVLEKTPVCYLMKIIIFKILSSPLKIKQLLF